MDSPPPLRNLGPVSRGWLAAIGIHTLQDLQQTGVESTWLLLRQHGYRVSLNLLYALAGAVDDCDWRQLSPSRKQQLQELAHRHRQ